MDTTINFKDLLTALSVSLDFAYTGLTEHHKRVAYISLEIANKMGLKQEHRAQIYCAAILHDIGAISMQEKVALSELEVKDPYTHCELGYSLTNRVPFLEPISFTIKTHHDKWQGGNPSGLKGCAIPLESRIIHVADRLDVLINNDVYILEQCEGILQKLKKLSGTVLDPVVFSELSDLALKESFWLDITSGFLHDLITKQLSDVEIPFSRSQLKDIAELFAMVIDGKSKFTYRHSRLVSAAAILLASLVGFSGEDMERVAVAGLLHDLGKLSIPEEILEKPGRLSTEEYRIIKRHTYYTYQILDRIPGFHDIKEWAAYHHEKLDGSGYPFHILGEKIPLGSRIIAVSDIFAALAEDRPYRRGLPMETIKDIFQKLCTNGSIDGDLVDLLFANYHHFKKLKYPMEMI